MKSVKFILEVNRWNQLWGKSICSLFFQRFLRKATAWFFFLWCYDFFKIQDSLFLLNQNPSEKQDVFRNTNSSVLYFILGLHSEEDKEVLESFLPAALSTGLKRQFPNDLEDAHDVNGPGKIPKKGQ